jgi:alpha-D-xyloside xylohydrolase
LVPIHRQAPKSGEKWPLTLQHYGQNPGAFTLYDDDGKTFDYEKGKFTLSHYTVEKNLQGKLVGNQATQVPMSYLPEVRWVFMTK